MSTRPSLMRAMRMASLLLLLSASAQAQPLAAQLDKLITTSEVGAGVAMHVLRLDDAQELYRRHADSARNPASNMKLLTAAAALRKLGPEFQMWTGLYGARRDATVPTLYIKGHGDPTLDAGGVFELARQIQAQGITAINEIIVDDSYFDDQVLPPAFEQQPAEHASFRASVAALSVMRNAFVVDIRPGVVGQTPAVELWPPQHFVLDNQMTTRAKPSAVRIDQEQANDGRLKVVLRGHISSKAQRVRYRRRVQDPVRYAGDVFAAALLGVGIGGRLQVGRGKTPDALPLLAVRRSASLGEMLHALGKWSDNFSAEMLLKVLGAAPGRPGKSSDGVQALYAQLKELGVPQEGLHIVNGSGLFSGNAVSPRQITATLAAMYNDSTLRHEYVSQLAIAGYDGTLKARLQDLPNARMVRAKTGTLQDVTALSGYILGKTPAEDIAFSILIEGVNGRTKAARDLADELVRRLAQAR